MEEDIELTFAYIEMQINLLRRLWIQTEIDVNIEGYWICESEVQKRGSDQDKENEGKSAPAKNDG